jgi:hypothetical protein
MPILRVILEGDAAWPDLTRLAAEHKFVHLGEEAPPIQIAGLAEGMQSGRPSVAIRLDLPDDTAGLEPQARALAETSLALFLTAAEALKARYGDPR